MKRYLLVFIVLFIIASQAHASLWGEHHRTELHDVFNHYFVAPGSQHTLASEIELLMSPYLMDSSADAFWGAQGDQFTVVSVYSDSRFGAVLGYAQNGTTWELAGSNRFSRYIEPNVSFNVESENGFMWSGASNWWGLERYSDYSQNWGHRDLFLAFAITDDAMLDYFYGGNRPASSDDLYLIAFDGLDWRRGNFTDLVAVVRRCPMAAVAAPLNAPLPPSLFILAGGTGLLAAVRRWASGI